MEAQHQQNQTFGDDLQTRRGSFAPQEKEFKRLKEGRTTNRRTCQGRELSYDSLWGSGERFSRRKGKRRLEVILVGLQKA